MSVPQEQKAILLNQTSLTAKFRFGQVMGKQKEHCDLTVHPQSGVLAPREELPITVIYPFISMYRLMNQERRDVLGQWFIMNLVTL